MRAIWAGLVMMFVLAAPASAQPGATCNAKALTALADYVLDNRIAQLSSFTSRYYGSTAAYLKIMYGDIDDTQASALALDLLASKASNADQLAKAYLVHLHGAEKARLMIGAENFDEFHRTRSNLSLARALMLSPDRDAFLDQIVRQDHPDQIDAIRTTVAALLDQPDDMKLLLASAASVKGLDLLAAGLLLSRENFRDFRHFMQTIESKEMTQQIMTEWSTLPVFGAGWMTTINSRPLSPAVVNFRFLLATEAMLGVQHFLTRAIKFSDLPPLLQIATEIINAAESGQIDATGRADDAYTLAFEGLIRRADDFPDVRHVMEVMPFNLERHHAPTLRATIDWMLSVKALQPYVTRRTASPPARPAGISTGFAGSWARFVAVAETVRDKTLAERDFTDTTGPTMAAELLFAAGRDVDLADFILKQPKSGDMVVLANDFAIRMDRTCDRLLNRPGETFFAISTPLYRFDRPVD